MKDKSISDDEDSELTGKKLNKNNEIIDISDAIITDSCDNSKSNEEKNEINIQKIETPKDKNEEQESNTNNEESSKKKIPITKEKEKYFSVPYSASLEKEEKFLTSLGWDKQQYGYEDSDVDDEDWEITDDEKIKFYNMFNNNCKNLFESLEQKKLDQLNTNRTCLECSTCFACPFPCKKCGRILLESGGLNNKIIQLHHQIQAQSKSNNNDNNNSLNNDSPTNIFQMDDADIDLLQNINEENEQKEKQVSEETKIERHHHVCQIHQPDHYKQNE